MAQRYPLFSRLLHWSIAAGILGLIWLGWYLVGLSYLDPWATGALFWHRAIGLLIFLLAVCAWLWRPFAAHPPLESALSRPQRVAARVVHSLLALAALAIPLTGYLTSSSDGGAIPMPWGLAMPALWDVSPDIRDLAIELHYWFAYGCGALVILHAGAALKHHFVNRDDTLRRML